MLTPNHNASTNGQTSHDSLTLDDLFGSAPAPATASASATPQAPATPPAPAEEEKNDDEEVNEDAAETKDNTGCWSCCMSSEHDDLNQSLLSGTPRSDGATKPQKKKSKTTGLDTTGTSSTTNPVSASTGTGAGAGASTGPHSGSDSDSENESDNETTNKSTWINLCSWNKGAAKTTRPLASTTPRPASAVIDTSSSLNRGAARHWQAARQAAREAAREPLIKTLRLLLVMQKIIVQQPCGI